MVHPISTRSSNNDSESGRTKKPEQERTRKHKNAEKEIPAWVVVVFFTLTDRASTIPSNTRGCQSGTFVCWTEKRSEEHLPSSNESKRKTQTHKKNDKEKGTGIKKYTGQKKINEGHSIERVWHSASREPSDTLPGSQPCTQKRVASTTFRTLRVSVVTNGTIDVA